MIANTGYWMFGDKQFESEHCFDEGLMQSIPVVLKSLNIHTMYDFGCGPGWYTTGILKHGIDCKGFDGNPITSQIPNCEVQDLTDESFRREKVDCVMCLEVAEHVPKEFESKLIDTMDYHVKSGGLLILSWAVPGQGGLGHVNCQANSYVLSIFKDRGYNYNEPLSNFLRDKSSLPWFKNTILVFMKQ